MVCDPLAGAEIDAAGAVDHEPNGGGADALAGEHLHVGFDPREPLLDVLLKGLRHCWRLSIGAKKRWAATPTSRCGRPELGPAADESPCAGDYSSGQVSR